MFRLFCFMLLCIAIATSQKGVHFTKNENVGGFKPYAFSYAVNNHRSFTGREERQDANGEVVGYYHLHNSDGTGRRVDYTAGRMGFRAVINTNEHGVAPKSPADVNLRVAQAPTIQHGYGVKTAPQPPMMGMPQSPIKGINQAPIKEINQAPIKTIQQAPLKGLEQAPLKGIEQAPIKSVIQQAPIKSIPQAPIKTVPQAPVKAVPQAPLKGLEQAPINNEKFYQKVMMTETPTPLPLVFEQQKINQEQEIDTTFEQQKVNQEQEVDTTFEQQKQQVEQHQQEQHFFN